MSTKRQRRKFTSEFKAKVALAAVKENETLATLSNQFDVHSNQVLKWKREFLENCSMAFDKKNEFESLEKDRDHLLRKVGELQMDKDFLKKSLWKLGH
jgi:transposase